MTLPGKAAQDGLSEFLTASLARPLLAIAGISGVNQLIEAGIPLPPFFQLNIGNLKCAYF